MRRRKNESFAIALGRNLEALELPDHFKVPCSPRTCARSKVLATEAASNRTAPP